jgi:flagellar basal body-associated protein FliL
VNTPSPLPPDPPEPFPFGTAFRAVCIVIFVVALALCVMGFDSDKTMSLGLFSMSLFFVSLWFSELRCGRILAAQHEGASRWENPATFRRAMIYQAILILIILPLMAIGTFKAFFHAESAKPEPHAESAKLETYAESAEPAPHAESAKLETHAEPDPHAESAKSPEGRAPSRPQVYADRFVLFGFLAIVLCFLFLMFSKIRRGDEEHAKLRREMIMDVIFLVFFLALAAIGTFKAFFGTKPEPHAEPAELEPHAEFAESATP